MSIFNKYPWTNFQDANLDYILDELKKLTDEWIKFEHQYEDITAQAESVPYDEQASVDVSGGDGQPFNFNFKIPYGKDLRMTSYQIQYGVSENENEQPTEWTNEIPTIPQAYYLWTRVTLNFNDGSSTTFFSLSRNGLDGNGSVVSVNNISPDTNGNIILPIPQASDTTPNMDAQVGNSGISNNYARQDHVHPSDTTKLDKQTSNENELKAYAIHGANQIMKPISQTPVSDGIASYDNNGNLKSSSNPIANQDVINKYYLEENYPDNTDIANYVRNNDVARINHLGLVKPDGSTINILEDGTISVIGAFSCDELWSNDNPTQEVGSMAVELNMQKAYKALIIVFRTSISTSVVKHHSSIVPILDVGRRYEEEFSAFYNILRAYSVLANGSAVQFETPICYLTYGSNQTSTTNTSMYLIPDKIYGIG